MRSRIVSVFSDALATHRSRASMSPPATELGEALLPAINPETTRKYGIQIASFVVENVSVPPEVEQAIDKRSSMAVIGNLNDYVKYQMGQGVEGGGTAGGRAAEMAVNLSASPRR